MSLGEKVWEMKTRHPMVKLLSQGTEEVSPMYICSLLLQFVSKLSSACSREWLHLEKVFPFPDNSCFTWCGFCLSMQHFPFRSSVLGCILAMLCSPCCASPCRLGVFFIWSGRRIIERFELEATLKIIYFTPPLPWEGKEEGWHVKYVFLLILNCNFSMQTSSFTQPLLVD